LTDGGSCIAAPDGSWIVEPADATEQLIVADLDLRRVYEERQNFDPVGHYSRPDVTRLVVNRQRQGIVSWEDSADD
jgi:nitrilase